MPKSDSDVTENASLTSDDEQIGPSSPVDRHSAEVPRVESLPLPSTRWADVAPLNAQSEYNIDDRPPLLTSGTSASRWKSSAMKVIQMNKSSAHFSSLRFPGAEPGADPRRPSSAEQFSHIHDDCIIQIVDYGATTAKFMRADNQGLRRFLNAEEGIRPHWSKVRWINIGGTSWDVLSALALKFDLHPLSVEDVLHERHTSLSKADYYLKHLFISTLHHSLHEADEHHHEDDSSEEQDSQNHQRSAVFPDRKMAASPAPQNGSKVEGLPGPVTTKERRSSWLQSRLQRSLTRKSDARSTLSDRATENSAENLDVHKPENVLPWILESIEGPDPSEHPTSPEDMTAEPKSSPSKIQRHTKMLSQDTATAENMAFLNQLKGDRRVAVDIHNVYLFLLRDGTVISIYKKDEGNVFGTPILNRLRQEHTLLRSSADASLLLQAILDYVVDDAMQVVEKYHKQILRLERQILIKPKMTTVRELHILSGDLTLHKRTLAPIKSLVYGLRRYDLDRYKALLGSARPSEKNEEAQGFMSHQSKVYLADVVDHMEYILSSLDMFASITENLINFTFNTISYQTNETMRRLSLATIIFFPLTFLTGYFGMNFNQNFWAIDHSDLFFWEIAIPVMFTIISMFMWPEYVRLVHFCEKKIREYRVKNRIKRD